jgi:hypothetical protein
MSAHDVLTEAAMSDSGRLRVRVMIQDAKDCGNAAADLSMTLHKMANNSDMSMARLASDSEDETFVYTSIVAAWMSLRQAQERLTAVQVQEIRGRG